MAATKKETAKGYGARYGPRVRQKFTKISKEQRKLYKCPYCGYVKVKRLAVGIWKCRKCDSKFTSRAYRVEKLTSVTTVIQEDIVQVEANE